jgi:methionyl-tRNA synthetase
MQMKNFYITSPIYYVNDVPHIGHAYTSVVCDTIARFKKLQNYDTYFLTGTDEHGQKVERSALAKNKTPQEFCDEISEKFRELAQTLGLSNNDFIRTTEERHKICAQKFWQILEKNGSIYKSVYEGWYALRDEAFYSEDEIVDGKSPTGAQVTWHKEESYFFRLSAFQEKLLALYEAVPDFIQPESRRNEVISFVKSGLKDLSISRTSFKWGVVVPDDAAHIMYVWLDALTNYISALGFPDSELYKKFWCNGSESPIHIVGKDIIRFHGVYWPAFLMSADIPIPYQVYSHGWWTNNGEKISKSTGNVIDPFIEINWLESLGCSRQQAVDYFRYFLLREISLGSDGDYSRQSLVVRINSELANNIGNLAQRTLQMIYKNNNAEIVDFTSFEDGNILLKNGYNLQEKIIQKVEKFAFDKAIFDVIDFATMCNQFINDKAPWHLKKDGKILEMNLVLSTVVEALRLIAISLQAFLPNLSTDLLDILQVDLRKMENVSEDYVLTAQHKVLEPRIIFPRIIL